MLIIMVSLTCSLLLEVGRSWEKRGKKAETESSKIDLIFQESCQPWNMVVHRRKTCVCVCFLKTCGKKNMLGMKEVTRPLVYVVSGLFICYAGAA